MWQPCMSVCDDTSSLPELCKGILSKQKAESKVFWEVAEMPPMESTELAVHRQKQTKKNHHCDHLRMSFRISDFKLNEIGMMKV